MVTTTTMMIMIYDMIQQFHEVRNELCSIKLNIPRQLYKWTNTKINNDNIFGESRDRQSHHRVVLLYIHTDVIIDDTDDVKTVYT